MIPLEDFTDEDEDGDEDPVMKVIWWRKLSIDESYLVMKVIIVKRSDDLWRFACGDVSSFYRNGT